MPSREQPVRTPPIAIVGVSALFPGSSDADGFWRDILEGRDLIGDVPAGHWLIEDYYDPDPKAPDKTYARRGAFIDPVDFDALGWGIPPSIVPATDTAQLLALIVAERVLADASRAHEIDRSRTSVILGVTSAQELLGAMVNRLQEPVWRKSLREMGLPESQVKEACERIAAHYTPWQEATFPGLLGNVVAGRIANRLNLGGTNCVTDAACASTFSALSMAVNELALGQSDLAIAGGVDTMNDIFMFMCFSKTPALSPSGDCRPFSASGDGTMLGEGLGMFALRRLEDAHARGDRIYAVIRGIGSGSDGRAKSVYAPLAEGQARTLRRAYSAAGYGPETVELVEAHGTGTRAGDAAEFSGLDIVFKEAGETPRAPLKPWCALGSVKSQIGHTKAAAGAAGLFKAVMAVNEGVLPPSIKIDRPNPKMDLEGSAFQLSTRALPWVRGSDHPRRASVSSFGFGGSNFHVALEEPKTPAPRRNALPVEILAVDANSAAELKAALDELKEALAPGRLTYLARRSHGELRQRPWRAAFVVRDEDGLAGRLDEAREHLRENRARPFWTSHDAFVGHGENPGPLAFLFPGQGSQYIDMGADLACRFAVARRAWDHAADIPMGDEPLHRVVFPPSAFDEDTRRAQQDKLTATEWAQPALGVVSLALLAVLEKAGLRPAMVGGHSFGELAALAAARALSETDFLRLARRRGELMAQAAETPGAMLAVFAPLAEVEAILHSTGSSAEIANHNGPHQVVIAGPLEAIETAEKALAEAHLRTKRLAVATAFHSRVVAGARDPFALALGETRLDTPQVPVFANVTATPHDSDPAVVRRSLAEQIATRVRFVEMVEAMHHAGARTFVEVGAGSVLTHVTHRILEDRPHRAIGLDRKGKPGFELLMRALAELFALGYPVDFASLFSEYEQPVDPAARKTPKIALTITGTNYGKPYPPEAGASALPGPNPERPALETPPPKAPAPPPSRPVAPERVASHDSTNGMGPKPAFNAALSSSVAPRANPAQRAEPSVALARPAPAALQGVPTHALTGAGNGASPARDSTLMAPPHTSRPANGTPAHPSSPWLTAWESAQASTADAQESFHRAMAESHAAYLRFAETSLSALSGLAGAVSSDEVPHPAAWAPPPPAALPRVNGIGAHAPSPAPLRSPPAAMPTGASNGARQPSEELQARERTPSIQHAPDPVRPEAPSPKPPRIEAPEAEASRATAAPPVDLAAKLRAVVSEATGYPEDVLQPTMSLEADLGIDSIKRVEILSMVKTAVPELPELDAAVLGSLETLGDVAQHLVDAVQGPAAPAAAPRTPKTGPGEVDLEAKLRSVVAEATGYPEDVLQPTMSLEADLGIDSIKRVEILSMVKTAVPELPELDAAVLGSLETLGDVAAHLVAAVGGSAQPATEESPPTAPQGPVDLAERLKTVVAEATGYPEDVLQRTMNLESDLGIDSIKRVEILSMVKTAVPDLPELDAATLGSLETLGDVADHLQAAFDGTVGQTVAVAASAPTTTGSAEPRTTAEHRFVPELVPAPPAGLARLRTRALRKVAVIGGPEAVRSAVAHGLAAAGFPARAAARPEETDDGLVLLHGLETAETPEASVDRLHAAFRALRAATGVFQSERAMVVSVQSTGGGLALERLPSLARAPLAGLAALIKTAALEAPQAVAVAIDVATSSPEDIARIVSGELTGGGLEREVAYDRHGDRFAVRVVARPADSTDLPLSPGDVLVASGGGRGVTAACLKHLARSVRARFVLLGRTPLIDEPPEANGAQDESSLRRALLEGARQRSEAIAPADIGRHAAQILAAREVRGTLSALNESGAEATYIAVDVTEAGAVRSALDEVRGTWGPIRGLIHAAGVIQDKRIVDKTDEQVDRVLSTKLRGLLALLEATQGDPLKAILLFSSVAAHGGNVGQSDYAMANAALDAIAVKEAEHRADCRVKSLAWGPWRGGMVSSALEAHFEAAGIPLIDVDEGAQWMLDELMSPGAVRVILGGDPGPGPLVAEDAAPRHHLEVRVDADIYPELEDHAIEGPPVVPLVLAAEWMLSALAGLAPGAPVLALEELRVQRGIALENWPGAVELSVSASLEKDGSARLALLDGHAQVRYAARGRALAALPAMPPAPESLGSAHGVKPYEGGPPKARVLFHGPRFQALTGPRGLDRSGARDLLKDARALGWTDRSRLTDPVRLDGAIQLAVLVTERILGSASLPTRLGQLAVQKSPAWTPGDAEAWTVTREERSDQAVHDAVVTDGGGQVVATLTGLETTRRPGWKAGR